MEDTVESKLDRAKVYLMYSQPFFGSLLSKTEIFEQNTFNDISIDTLCTDGLSIYYNREFVSKLTQREIEFSIIHELLHCALDHIKRSSGFKNISLCNIAQDFVINAIINDFSNGRYQISDGSRRAQWMGNDQNSDYLCDIVLYDRKFSGKTFEEVYEILDKDPESYGLSSTSGDEQEDSGNGQSNAYEYKNNPHTKSTLDNHIIQESDTEETEDDVARENKIKHNVIESYQESIMFANSSISPAVIRCVEKWLTPKVDWKSYISQTLRSLVSYDTSYMVYNKRSNSSGFILPGNIKDNSVDIVCAIDMSGSTYNFVDVFFSELVGILESFDKVKLHLFCFDTKVHKYEVFDECNIEEIQQYEPVGLGGTSYECIFEFIEEEQINADKLIVFTDGYPYSGWGNPDVIDTIFLICGNPDAIAPFGETIHWSE